MERHHYLVLDEYHLAHTDAYESVVALLTQRGAAKPDAGWEELTMSWTNRDGKIVKLAFEKLVEHARRTGIVRELQSDLDAADYVFGSSFSVPVPVSGSGHSMKLKGEYAGFLKELSVPCRYASIEGELVEDILYYRAAACSHSDADDLIDTCRYFRAYLFACEAVVEAFVNRYVLMYSHTRTRRVDPDAFKRLPTLEEKVDLWLQTFAHSRLADISESHEWYELKRLMKSRHDISHGRHAFLGHNIRDIAREFNYVRDGVGGLLHLMRLIEGEKSVGFIERLRTAPRITFNQPRTRHVVLR